MSFQSALLETLHYEGGIANHPKDRGGLTNYGITQKTYDAHRDEMKAPRRSVELIEDHEIQDIYRNHYWNACNCDALPEALASAVFDMAVNSGTWNAKLTLQRALRVKEDGVIGPATIDAAKKTPDAVLAFLKRRAKFIGEVLITRPDQAVFAAGWINRLLDQAWKGGNK